jgi:protein-S-isoprenylcysteine O-methyltransferase Ste14
MTDKNAIPSDRAEEPVLHFGRKAIFRFLLYLVLLPAVLFIAAGTAEWPMGWLFAALYVFAVLIGRMIVIRKFPDLLMERAQYLEAKDTRTWDKILVPIMALYGPLVVAVVTGLDKRFGWSGPISLAVQMIMLILVIFGYFFSNWALVVNRYFSAVVRIQKDRGHTVVKDGPYRLVRHPGYAGGLLAQIALPVMLGSLWALIPAVLVAICYCIRTALEDRELRTGLPGYEEYTRETRSRLIPGIW